MKENMDTIEQQLITQLKWLIGVRWNFIIFIVFATLIASHYFIFFVYGMPLYLIATFIAAYNGAFEFAVRRTIITPPAAVKRFVYIQSMLDIISLTLLIHLTGGAENPFVFYFIFHTITTSLLLSKRESYIQTVIVSFIVVGMFGLEYSGALPHHAVGRFPLAGLYANPVYAAAISFVFISTLLIAAFVAASIAEKLREANLKLWEKDRLKDEYVKMVAHDIKSPLSAMQSLLETILGGFSGNVDGKIKEILQRVQKKIEFLHHYTKDLLDLSRIRAERNLNIQRVNIKELIYTAAEIALPKIEEKHIELKVAVDVEASEIEADNELLIYAFANLIANAFKYTPSGGTVLVKVSHYNDIIAAEVKDTGIGIPAEDMPHIFKEFFRAGNVAKTTKGTGLGLSLVKYIIERHGGKISAESQVNKGSAFKFILPTKQPL